MHQSDRVENALDNPQLFDLQQLDRGRAPPDTTRTVAGLEARFHLAEAMRPINQALPVTSLFQREPHRGAAGV
ncbi:hypothetical protein D3C87_911410 [compost metagenome]